MHQELKDSYILIVTAKENADTPYNGRNATRK